MARERSGHRPRFRLAPVMTEAVLDLDPPSVGGSSNAGASDDSRRKTAGTPVPDGRKAPTPSSSTPSSLSSASVSASTAASASAASPPSSSSATDDGSRDQAAIASDGAVTRQDGEAVAGIEVAVGAPADAASTEVAATDDTDTGQIGAPVDDTGRGDVVRSIAPEIDAESAIDLAGIRKTTDPIESYEDRVGYRPDFIDEALDVPLPVLSAALNRDAVAFTWKGQRTRVLDYTHFSTVVSKSRRLPLFSACNLDGARPREVDRTSWRRDPRIPAEYQLLDGVYGNERNGFFSRGHMTRRRDVLWGSKQAARQANADTFHATNAAPQVQRFNGGIWNELEDYILANSRKDQLRISVFTGPVFAADDPSLHGVKIPLRYWKVVGFVHRQTGKLSAVGYLASQATEVADLKSFAFGAFMDQQRPLTAIEKLTGLSFGSLTAADVLAGASDNFAVALDDVRDMLLD